MEKISLSRRQLYDLIWSEPLLMLAKKYNISDVGLRKMCVRLNIPLPEIGYWNKVKAGKKVTIKPFIEQKTGEQSVSLALRDKSLPEDELGISPELALQRKIEADPTLKLGVPTELTDPDPLILPAQRALSKVPKDYRDGDLLFSGSDALDIRVSITQVNRALLLMDTFIKVMQQRGHHFELTDRESCLVIWKSRYSITLREGTTIIPDKDSWRRPTFTPNGIFTIQFDHWGKMTMKDGQKPIEQQLAKLIARLEIKAMEERRWREENERQQAIREEKERQQRLVAERKKNELESFRTVIKNAQRWKVTETIKEYIVAVEQEALKKNGMTSELIAWLNWVKKKTDWFDPMIEAEDDWLSGIDRDSLLAPDESKQPSTTHGRSSYNEDQPVIKRGWPLLPWYLKKAV
ncbi:hypothetical protein [Mucilaginibacter sp. OK098]|uniref:hypothetical protein n=1 Tax=Mucilaginibacter sp. OK098 TaxID=1855297 RepID=UPI00091CBC40|nr:hypothetical protein [Mucilaginibacter sp. OK098]SHN32928.1 hypothetical protein SAMN05216524_11024 [Mucilaginibacter sp. OK098]